MEEGEGVSAFPGRSSRASSAAPPRGFELEARTPEFSLAG